MDARRKCHQTPLWNTGCTFSTPLPFSSFPFVCFLKKWYQPWIQLVKLRLCFQNIKQVWRACLDSVCSDILVPLEDCWQSTPLWTGGWLTLQQTQSVYVHGLYQERSEREGDSMACLTGTLVRVITLPRAYKALQEGVRASPGSGQTPCSCLDVSLQPPEPAMGSAKETTTWSKLNQHSTGDFIWLSSHL